MRALPVDVFPEALESPEVFFPTLDADAERTCAGDVAGRWADACAKRGAVDDALTRRRQRRSSLPIRPPS